VNTANAGVTPNTIQGQSGDLAVMFSAWEVVDEYTVSAPFKNFDSTWQRGLLNVWYQSVDVLSKKVFDQLGETKANETAIATGPFKQKSWVEHDRIEATALPKHWRATAKIAGFVIREMPEEAARIAAIKTGEMQIIQVAALRNVSDLNAAGMVTTLATLESQHAGISFTGNLWEKNHAITGAPLERKGLKADDDHPWIGDPDNPARMESARKVRLAMAMAIDRKAINDTILGGLGTDNPLPFFSRNNKELWEERWNVTYDVAGAKKLMADAGYPNGFKSKVRMVDLVNYGPPEISKAVAGMWRDAFGLTVEVDLSPATWRPEIVARSGSDIWVTGCDEGRNLPADWPRGKVASSVTRGGFSCGSEFPEYAKLFLASAKEPDRSKRIANNKELGDFAHKWTTMAGTVEVPGVWTYDPRKIQTWGLRRGFKNTLNSFETIELK
jgi:peptide/nickel transport system substrate-binding protein